MAEFSVAEILQYRIIADELERQLAEARETGIRAFTACILHGDQEHRAWLLEAAEAYVAGRVMPEPRGGGDKEALIKALRDDNARLNGQIAEWSKTNLEIIAKCSSVEHELAGARAELSQVKSVEANVERMYRRAEDRIHKLESELRAARFTAKRAFDELVKAGTARTELERKLTKALEKPSSPPDGDEFVRQSCVTVADLVMKNAELERMCAEAQAERNELAAQIEEWGAEKEAACMRADAAERQLAELQDAARQHLAEGRAALAELRAQNT